MKKHLGYALIGTMLLGLTGCGLKGPLYFPGTKGKVSTTQPDSGHVEKNQQDPQSTGSSGI